MNTDDKITMSDEERLLNSPKKGDTSTPKSKKNLRTDNKSGSSKISIEEYQIRQAALKFAAESNLTKESVNPNSTSSDGNITAVKGSRTQTIINASTGLVRTISVQSRATQNVQKKQFAPSSGKFVNKNRPNVKHNLSTKNSNSAPSTSTNVGDNRVSASQNLNVNVQEVPFKPRRRGGKRFQKQKVAQINYAQKQNQQMPEQSTASTSHSATKLRGVSTNKTATITSQQMLSQGDNINSTKRGRAAGDTPPDLVRGSKLQRNDSKGNAKTTALHAGVSTTNVYSKRTAASVVSDANLLVAIVDMPVQGVVVPFTKERHDKIRAMLTAFLMAQLENPQGSIHTFTEVKYVRGHIRVRCSTPGAKTWLASALQYAPPKWKDMKLAVIDYDKIPSPQKILGFFPFCTSENEKICEMLNQMNACIDVTRWTILTSKKQDSGTHIAFAVDKDQFSIVKSCKFELYFGFGTATFKDITKTVSNPGAEVESEVENDDTMEIEEEEKTVIEKDIMSSKETDETLVTPAETDSNAMQVEDIPTGVNAQPEKLDADISFVDSTQKPGESVNPLEGASQMEGK